MNVLPNGPKDAHSTVLSIEDEAIIVAFRKHILLPLGDCLYALQPTIRRATRSSRLSDPIWRVSRPSTRGVLMSPGMTVWQRMPQAARNPGHIRRHRGIGDMGVDAAALVPDPGPGIGTRLRNDVHRKHMGALTRPLDGDRLAVADARADIAGSHDEGDVTRKTEEIRGGHAQSPMSSAEEIARASSTRDTML